MSSFCNIDFEDKNNKNKNKYIISDKNSQNSTYALNFNTSCFSFPSIAQPMVCTIFIWVLSTLTLLYSMV